MFQVERFGFGRAGGAGEGERKSEEEKRKALDNLIQRSRQRIHYKSLSNQQSQSQSQFQQQGRHGEKQHEKQSKERIVKPINIEKLLETNEEKKQRKLLAKQEKRERKERLRAAQEMKPEEEEEEEDQLSDHIEEAGEDEDEGDQEVSDLVEKEDQVMSKKDSNQIPEPPVSYAPFSLPNKDQKSSDVSRIQSPMIPPAIQIKEKVTVRESVAKWGVAQDLAEDIISDGIEEFFPVQVAVIPLLLSHSLYQPFAPPRDMIVSAPTGSGKTLAYAVPIIQTLSSEQKLNNSQRSQRRLHALIILPSRELVSQVGFISLLLILICPVGVSNLLSSCAKYHSSYRPSLWSH